ncbi:HSF-type DNA-binding-domain-containing protein [Scheffersomyces coipomensis]|uniref:HSF-type DNA-binding-domain-containing protein n=1 Tax=Scheffersomyces coipomensis TaxID=1788519 RepID=UPI00315CDBE1
MASSHDDDPIIELFNEDDFHTDDHPEKSNYFNANDKNSNNHHNDEVDQIINRDPKSDPFDMPTPNLNNTYVNTPILPQHQLYEVFDEVDNKVINDKHNNRIDELESNGSGSYDNSLLAPINDFISHGNNQLALSSNMKPYLPPLSPLSESVIPNGLSIQPLTLPIVNNEQNNPQQQDQQHQHQQSQASQGQSTQNLLTANTNTASSKRSKKEPTGPKTRPLFVTKLWSMVNDPNNKKYIRWNDNGQTFQVYHREEFMRNVLPKYFKHNNFASFVRQLNMYGWHKVQDINSGTLSNGSIGNNNDNVGSDDEILQFENPNFIRGQEELLDKIVRNKPTTNQSNDENGANNLNVLNNSTTNTINQINFQILINELDQIKMNQLAISEDLRRIRKDNKTLWNENFMARERHSTQAQTLDKILNFLSVMYGNNSGAGKILEVNDVPFNNLNSNVGNNNNAVDKSVNDLYNDANNVYAQAQSSAGQPFKKQPLMLTQKPFKQSPKSSSSSTTSTRHNSSINPANRTSVAESSTGSIEEIMRSIGNTPTSNNNRPGNYGSINNNRPSNESVDNANRIYQQIINQEPVPPSSSGNSSNNNLVSSPRNYFPELNSNVNSPAPYLAGTNTNAYMRIDEPVPNSTDIITGLEQNIYKQGQSIQQVQDWIQKLAQQQQQLQQQQQDEQRRQSSIIEDDEDDLINNNNNKGGSNNHKISDDFDGEIINSNHIGGNTDEFDVNEFLNSTQPINPSSEGDVITPNSVVNIDLTEDNHDSYHQISNNNNNYRGSKRSLEEVYDTNNSNNNNNNLRSNQKRKVNRKG